jgi:hypothetical protein
VNWKLVFALSLFGLAMGIGSVFFIPPPVEPVLWLVIFLGCAYLIAKNVESRHFLHGLCLGLANSVWITAFHVAFVDTYLSHHEREAAMTAGMSSPRLMMVLTGPVVGFVSGLVLGLFAWIASRFVKPTKA